MGLKQELVKKGAKYIAVKVLTRSIPAVGTVLLAHDAYQIHKVIRGHNKKKVDPWLKEAEIIDTAIAQIGDSSRSDYQYGGAVGELTHYEQLVYSPPVWCEGYDEPFAMPGLRIGVPPEFIGRYPNYYGRDGMYVHYPDPEKAAYMLNLAMLCLSNSSYEHKTRIIGQLRDIRLQVEDSNHSSEYGCEREDLLAIVHNLKDIRSDYLYNADKNRSGKEPQRNALLGLTGLSAIVTGVVAKKLLK